MKFYCDNCHAKYAIADEKVRGKILKVRCKTCEHVITVREPRAPAPADNAGSRPLPPRAPTRVAWHYAINGQSFGPFEEDKLCAMFEAGEVGDASYVWQAAFGSEWKPARAIPQFSSAIDKGAALRPRNKTIGVSSALEAINVDNSSNIQERDEEEGFVPGASAEAAPADGMNQRIAGLREQLKKHDAPSPEAKRNPFAPKPSLTDGPVDGADSTTQMGRDEIAAALGAGKLEQPPVEEEEDAPELDHAGPTDPDPVSGEDLGEALFGDDGAGEELDGSEDGDESDLFPAFGGMDAPDESVIDFSRLAAPSEAADDGAFNETPLVVDKEIEKEGGDFKASNSLLIQLDSIQKQGRGKRVALGLVALVLVGAVGAVAAVAASNSQKKTEPKTNSVYEPQKKELVFKTYAKDELGLVFELGDGEEVLTADDRKEIIEEMKAGDDKNNGAAVKPRVVAKNDTSGQKPDIDDQKPNLRGIGSGMNDLLKSDNKLGKALDDSKAADRNADGGLKTSGDDNTGAALKTKGPESKGKADDTPWGEMKSGSSGTPSALARIRRNDQMNKGNQEKISGPRLGDDGVLSKDAAKAGFNKIKRSVASCHQRQVTRGLPLSSSKVHITVEIQGTGKVSDLKISPASFKHSEFETCMQDHRKRGRWKFDAYGGKTVKIKHTYVLQ